jgi:hypothetical protein
VHLRGKAGRLQTGEVEGRSRMHVQHIDIGNKSDHGRWRINDANCVKNDGRFILVAQP